MIEEILSKLQMGLVGNAEGGGAKQCHANPLADGEEDADL